MLKIVLPFQVRVLFEVSVLVSLEIHLSLSASMFNGLLGTVLVRFGVYWGSACWPGYKPTGILRLSC